MTEIEPRTPLEASILADPEWRAGAAWGTPRPGHPEGTVLAHTQNVLANVERLAVDETDLARLRLVAIVHDAFKHAVDPRAPAAGENHHAMRARRFAERFIDDEGVLSLIELHDEAHNAWAMGMRDPRRWPQAERRAQRLIERLGAELGTFLRFFEADSATAGKSSASLDWFRRIAAASR